MSSRACFAACRACLVLLFACGGDDESSSSSSGSSGTPPVDTAICDVNSKCPNEPPETDADKKACKGALEGKCAASYRTLDTCQKANEVCDGTGKADINASAQKCKTELDAYIACSTGKGPSDAGAD